MTMLRRVYEAGKTDLVLLDHAFFLHVPMSGLLQFDYVVHLRPEASRRYVRTQRQRHACRSSGESVRPELSG